MSDEQINEADTKHASHIPESVIDKLYNSIVRNEMEDIIGTGFFIKIIINLKIKFFLITCQHVITQKDIDCKKTIELFFGKIYNETKKSLKLDNNQRYIACFGEEIDVTAIEILRSDEIPENKFLLPDLSYKYGYDIYKNGKFLLAGYPRDKKYEKERHISSGTIKKITGITFSHSLDTRCSSSGSPICLIDTVQVIGIHNKGNITKSINYGIFIGVIIDKLGKIYKEVNMKTNQSKYFYTLEDYNNNGDVFAFQREIIYHCNNQSEANYDKAINELEQYLNNNNSVFKGKDSLMKSLKIFKNVEKNYKQILREFTGENDFRYLSLNLFHEYDNKFRKKLTYFFGGLLKALFIAENYSNIGLKKNCQLFECFDFPMDELGIFKENINKIISFKSFFSASKILFPIKNKTLIKINYEYIDNCSLDCYDISNFSCFSEEKEVLFQPFSFFKIIKVEKNEKNGQAEITLNSIGKERNYESKLSQSFNVNLKINNKQNLLEIN